MPEPIKVDPQALAQAANRIRGHAEQLAAGHTSALSAADGARPGLVGKSAGAINSTMHRWQATTAELHRLLQSQSDTLKSAAAAYAQTEENNLHLIASLAPTDL